MNFDRSGNTRLPAPAVPTRPEVGLRALASSSCHRRSGRLLPRSASVTLVALIALVVLGILIMALWFAVTGSHKQIHHAYYNEKAMALIEGINAIARGQAQKNLQQILEAAGEWYEIPGIMETAKGLYLIDENEVEPKVKVEARVLKADSIKYYAESEPYDSLKEDKDPKAKGIFKRGNEVEGIVEIRVELEIGAFSRINFKVPRKTIITQYEFKRIRRVPPFIRHFALFVKKAITEKEDPDKFSANGNFNFARVPLTGSTANGCGVLFVKAGSAMSPMQLPRIPEGAASEEAKKANPFYGDTGYVYLGGDGDDTAYLNLTAGNEHEPYSETFQLYRGTTTDFYKVWDVDFTNFIEKARADQQGGSTPPAAEGAPDTTSWVNAAWSWLKDKVKAFFSWLKSAVKTLAELDAIEYTGKSDQSANLPLYYIVRKDYGYALEWGQKATYRRFGFAGDDGGSGIPIYCNALHLYGTQNFDGSDATCPTLVLGNVYRRYLSLAGYKQRRATDNPSVKRKFEVQAGPIEYFKTYKDLMKRGQDPTVQDEDRAPIWVWDARVDWNRGARNVNGTYLPISGAALFGRIIPGLARLWEDDKALAAKLFKYSICPPDELSGGEPPERSAEVITSRGGDFDEDVPGGISPLFVRLFQHGFFNKPPDYYKGRIYSDTSPYFEELSRCFAYASYGTIRKLNEGTSGDNDDLEGERRRIVELAAQRWQDVLTQGAANPKFTVKPIRFPDDMKTAECKKRAKFWEPSDRSGSGPDQNVYPFSLPDPWSRAGGARPNFQESFELACSEDNEDFFKRYFYHIMTNPAMVQPYNNGMRFIFKPLRDIFSKSSDERMKELSEDIIPEVRDGISFIVDGKNDYLKRDKKDRFNKPINDDVLKKIYARRKSDAYLQKGYFFMDDYGDKMKCPADANLADVFKGRRHFWKMGWEDFKRRFVTVTPAGQTIRLNTVVALTEDLVIDQKTQVIGGGAIIVGSGEGNGPVKVDGRIEIKADLFCDKPLFLVAAEIRLGGELQNLSASLVALKDIRLGGFDRVRIKGNICCESWNFRSAVARGGGQYLLDFNSALKTDDSYIQNIEPRIHRFHIVGGEGR